MDIYINIIFVFILLFIFYMTSKYVIILNIMKNSLIIKSSHKQKERSKNINKKYFKNYIIIIIILLILLKSIESERSKIILNIKGIGVKNIFSIDSSYNFVAEYLPNEIIVNGKYMAPDYNHLFEQENNEVELVWDNNLEHCAYMFFDCSDITKIDLSNFDSSKVEDIEYMFHGCSSLTSLDLTNFHTEKVEDMESLFNGCSSLTSLDLSNFDTSNVSDMNKMFYNCFSLTSLDLSNFITSKVMQFSCMFYNCTSLSSLNLSNFNFQSSISIMNMFENCVNLEYINIKNCEKIYPWDTNIFQKTPDNLVICISNLNTDILSQLQEKNCYLIDCSDNWREKQKKIINETRGCVNKCDNTQYPYEYNGKCFSACEKGNIFKNNLSTNDCKCLLDKCLSCPNVAFNLNLCTKCNSDYHQIENDPLNL